MSRLTFLVRAKENLVVGSSRARVALIGSVLLMFLASSCTGPPMPRQLIKFAEVDILAPEVRRIKIVEVTVGSELEDMEDVEKHHIAGELRGMIEGALGRGGYESVSVGEDAELSLTYSQSRASPGDAARRRGVADVSLAVVDRERKQVIYRGYSLHLPDDVPEGLFAFDVIEGAIEEHVGRIFGPGEWD